MQVIIDALNIVSRMESVMRYNQGDYYFMDATVNGDKVTIYGNSEIEGMVCAYVVSGEWITNSEYFDDEGNLTSAHPINAEDNYKQRAEKERQRFYESLTKGKRQ